MKDLGQVLRSWASVSPVMKWGQRQCCPGSRLAVLRAARGGGPRGFQLGWRRSAPGRAAAGNSGRGGAGAGRGGAAAYKRGPRRPGPLAAALGPANMSPARALALWLLLCVGVSAASAESVGARGSRGRAGALLLPSRVRCCARGAAPSRIPRSERVCGEPGPRVAGRLGGPAARRAAACCSSRSPGFCAPAGSRQT